MTPGRARMIVIALLAVILFFRTDLLARFIKINQLAFSFSAPTSATVKEGGKQVPVQQ